MAVKAKFQAHNDSLLRASADSRSPSHSFVCTSSRSSTSVLRPNVQDTWGYVPHSPLSPTAANLSNVWHRRTYRYRVLYHSLSRHAARAPDFEYRRCVTVGSTDPGDFCSEHWRHVELLEQRHLCQYGASSAECHWRGEVFDSILYGSNYETLVEPLENCVKEGKKNYKSVLAGDYVWRRLAKSRFSDHEYNKMFPEVEAVA